MEKRNKCWRENCEVCRDLTDEELEVERKYWAARERIRNSEQMQHVLTELAKR